MRASPPGSASLRSGARPRRPRGRKAVGRVAALTPAHRLARRPGGAFPATGPITTPSICPGTCIAAQPPDTVAKARSRSRIPQRPHSAIGDRPPISRVHNLPRQDSQVRRPAAPFRPKGSQGPCRPRGPRGNRAAVPGLAPLGSTHVALVWPTAPRPHATHRELRRRRATPPDHPGERRHDHGARVGRTSQRGLPVTVLGRAGRRRDPRPSWPLPGLAAPQGVPSRASGS